MAERPFLLVTNDDGIHAPGLHALCQSLKTIADIVVVAPSVERSAVGHAITISDPLRVFDYYHNEEFFGYAVDGTPADCVKIAYWAILDKKPDAVISGINLGINTGINTIYSGTVSAATEGAILDLPSFAISLATYTNPDFSYAAKFAAQLIPTLFEKKLPKGIFLNVNVPACKEDDIQGVQITRQGMALYKEEFDKRTDPNGRVYYWLTGTKLDKETSLDVDDGAVASNYVSITPVHYDMTAVTTLNELKTWNLRK